MSPDDIVRDCNAAANSTDDAYANTVADLRAAKERMLAGIDNMRKKRCTLTEQSEGTVEANRGDLIEINAGGQTILVKRGKLTQCEGSILEALFSGRYENKLLRDSKGRVFLDVDSNCFQKIVSFLCDHQDAAIDEGAVVSPCVDEEVKSYFDALVSALGLENVIEVSSENDVKQADAANDPEEWEALTFDEINGRLKVALESEKQTLIKAKEWLTSNEALFQKEKEIIPYFLQDDNGIVQLSVKGKLMTTK